VEKQLEKKRTVVCGCRGTALPVGVVGRSARRQLPSAG
jgi:hypothetical protein